MGDQTNAAQKKPFKYKASPLQPFKPVIMASYPYK